MHQILDVVLVRRRNEIPGMVLRRYPSGGRCWKQNKIARRRHIRADIVWRTGLVSMILTVKSLCVRADADSAEEPSCGVALTDAIQNSSDPENTFRSQRIYLNRIKWSVKNGLEIFKLSRHFRSINH